MLVVFTGFGAESWYKCRDIHELTEHRIRCCCVNPLDGIDLVPLKKPISISDGNPLGCISVLSKAPYLFRSLS